MSRRRRFLLAAFSIALALGLLHERCADVLVMKADGELAAGQIAKARMLYHRALWLHPADIAASERLIFSDLEDGSVAHLREAMALSAEALKHDPHNVAILTDRGLCALRLGDDHAAENAFYTAGKLSNDGRLLYLSALAAHRLGENIDIRMYETHHAGGGKRA